MSVTAGTQALGAAERAAARLVVAVPMRLEAWLVRAGAPGLAVRRTGMGRRRAEAASPLLRELAGAQGTLAVLGFAGGLDREGRPGEAVVASELIGPGGERRECVGAQALVGELVALGMKARAGAICSVARPALGSARERLCATGAIAVDMESLWLASADGPRCAVVRVLSDVPRSGAPRPDRALSGFARACAALRLAARGVAAWSERGGGGHGGLGAADAVDGSGGWPRSESGVSDPRSG